MDSLARPPGHQRNKSDASASAFSVASYTGSEIVSSEERSDEVTVFVAVPPKNLICMLCTKVFHDPVIAKCGVRTSAGQARK